MKFLILPVLLMIATGNAFAQPKVGDIAPPISLKDVSGKTVELSSLNGKVVLLDFWASWCGPCRKANRYLTAMHPRYKNKGFEILSVSLDDSKEDWKKAIVKDKLTWLQVNERGGWDATVSLAYKIEQLPTTFLIDKKGRIAAVDLEGEKLEEKIKSLLNE